MSKRNKRTEPTVETEIEKSTEPTVEKKVIKFPDLYKKSERVLIIGTAKSKHLKEGTEYEVNGETANILIGKGDATLKK